jgi:hypothetical protein
VLARELDALRRWLGFDRDRARASTLSVANAVNLSLYDGGMEGMRQHSILMVTWEEATSAGREARTNLETPNLLVRAFQS